MNFMRTNWIIIAVLSVGLLLGCKTSQKRPQMAAPPESPAMPKAARLRLQAAPEVKRAGDTDFPTQFGDSTVLLVKPKAKTTERQTAEFHKNKGGKVTKFKYIPWEAVKLPKGQEDKLYREYKQSSLFERVQFQRIYKIDAIPDDPLFTNQWALTKIEAPAAWDKRASNDVIVAVFDTGIDYDHPDLKDNLWTGARGEHGYTSTNAFLIDGGKDDHYHGTHVSGTIAATGNNGIGVAGINWRTKLLSMKFIGANGSGKTVDALLCIEKMIDLKTSGLNIRVANNSWGGFGTDAALEDAFIKIEDAGILSVCAAGNSGIDIDEKPFVPASLPNAGLVSVLASTTNDTKIWFSNFGIVSTDLLAPGVGILSCMTNNDYRALSGTSMATPHVAGAMAMVFSFNPNLNPRQAKDILLHPDSLDKTPFAINSTAGGRLNLRKLWNNPAIFNPPSSNLPPVITRSPDTNLVFVAPGQTTPISITGVDPEGQLLTYNMTWETFKLPWFYRYMMGGATIYALTNFGGEVATNVHFATGKYLALDQNAKIRIAATDGSGAGSGTRFSAFTFRDESKVLDIQKAIRGFRFWDDDTGHPWFRLDVDPTYPELASVMYHLRIYTAAGVPRIQDLDAGSPCCHRPNIDIRADDDRFHEASYSIHAEVMDKWGNAASSPVAQYFVSNSFVRPPTVAVTLNTNRGVAPLKIHADMTATAPGDATFLFYEVRLMNEYGLSMDIFNPVREFTLEEPGVYAVEFTSTAAAQPITDTVIKTFTVLPEWPGRKVMLTQKNGAVTISWTEGVLQETTNLNAAWFDSSNQNNPQIRPATGNRFFRTR